MAKKNGGSGLALLLGLSCLDLLLLTCVINPASSLARFVPQMWLFPLMAVMLAYRFPGPWLRGVGSFIIGTLLVNNLLVGITYFQYNSQIRRVYQKRLKKMAGKSAEKPIPVYFGHFRTSSTLRFDRLGIRYRMIEKKEDCPGGKRILPDSILLECVSPE